MTDIMPDDLEEVVDPNALLMPEPVEMTRTFTDPNQPRKKFTLTLRSDADAFFSQRIVAKAAPYIADFVTGKPDPNRTGAKLPPAPVLLTPGRGIVPIEEMFTNIAALQLLQVGKKWDVHAWAAVAVKAPIAFSEMMAFGGEVIARACGTWVDEAAETPDGDTSPDASPPNV